MRFPEEIERISRWENLVSQTSKGGKSTFFAMNKGSGDGIWQCVRWSKTKRGSTEIDVDLINETEKICSSIYGLCE